MVGIQIVVEVVGEAEVGGIVVSLVFTCFPHFYMMMMIVKGFSLFVGQRDDFPNVCLLLFII